MKYLLSITFLVLLCSLYKSVEATHPPEFTLEPSKRQIVYDVSDTLTLPWVASCDPNCSYSWEFNGKPFDPAGTDNRVVNSVGLGTLVFASPESQFSGFYKCFARNDFGLAVSDTVQIINASLGKFPEATYPEIFRIAGQPLRIICNRPESFPLATIYWVKEDSSGGAQIDQNDRVTMDPDGGLNFAYVQQSDDGNYYCVAYNEILRTESASNPHKLRVSGSAGESQSPPSKANWIARTSETFMRGQNASIKCIYAGKPVPGVIWKRTDDKELSLRATRRSFGLELFFHGIEYEDAGSYECDGYNSAQPTPLKTTVLVTVNGAVTWVREPVSVTKGENETVTFECLGEGAPRPNPPKWYINWEQVTANTPDRIIGDQYGPSTTFTIKNLKKERDTMAIQCNTTNYLTGSWAYKSFYLNVQSERPTIVQFNSGLQKWAATKDYVLKCKIFGAPTPVISWKRDGQSLTGGRFITGEDGSLHVKNVGITDAGTYECSATNVHGSASKATEVVVRRPTTIQQAPEDLTVTEGTQAKFVCTALTDPDEAQNMKITWLKDGKSMNYYSNNRVYMNVQDNSLQIAGPIALDSGLYTCKASNGIDSDERSATLRVQGKPDRPPVVSIEKCRANSAKVKWSPGTNSNAPLTSFTIQYQTEKDESIWYRAAPDLPPKITEYEVTMKPDNTYKFRVLATNKIGTSEPSDPTPSTCTTTEALPIQNPRGVRTLDEGEDRLVITWQPISRVDFGGSSFVYIIKYRQAGQNECKPEKKYCEKSTPSLEDAIGRPGELNIIEYKIIVYDQPVYTKYEIMVNSRNTVGDSSETPEIVFGYSGEGNPRQDVFNFRLKVDAAGEEMVYSDNATFVWDAVDESGSETQGFFRGYMIQYKKRINNEASDEFFDTRSIYVVIRDVKMEGGSINETKIENNELGAWENPDDGTVSVTINHLPADSELDFQIAVINKRHYGTLSPVFSITTKEGVPGPVQQLRITENGPTHARLSWQRPIEPNGVLTEYMIGFKSLNGLQLGPMQNPDSKFVAEPRDANQRVITAKVTGLKPLQMYRFYVWAYTRAGQGSEYFIDDSTVAADYPDPPSITVDKLSNNTLNVSWVPADTGVPANVFYVQYKQESAIDQWQRTGWETNKNYILVSNFVDGWRYEIMVVASNGGIYERSSSSVKIFPTATSRAAAEATVVFGSSWFIGLLFALILVTAFFALLCYIQRNVGGIHTGQFTVEETERLRPYEDNHFDEKSARVDNTEPEMTGSERYAPSHFSERYPQSIQGEKYAPSQHSERYVGNQHPTQDEYMQDDPNKYGEEGSFIGQYRDNKELPNFKPRVSEPYRPPVQPPQPRARAPPSEAMYAAAPVPEPRNGGNYSRGGRNGAPESSAEYRPQYAGRSAPSYAPDTRYRPAQRNEPEVDTNDTVV